MKFLTMTNEQPYRKADIGLILGPYGFNSFREISLTKLWKAGGWEVLRSSGKLERVKKDFASI
jgi:hypothetical protein